MPEIIRTRDCVVFVKDETIPVTVSDAMVTGGWPGGQGVQWIDSAVDEFKVDYSDGDGCGFLVWGSNEAADQFTGMTGAFTYYKYAVLFYGGALFSTSSYEVNTYASRQAGPLVTIVYAPQDKLYFSLRGLWTNEDEWTLSLDPRAPNTNIAGIVVQIPKPLNSNFLTIQSRI